jgi:UDP-N-acetylmuramoyl-L-alanyl-D-glutamate--2,6-diaminopimelate ligase
VDYAHTPDALKNVLFHAKELAKSRLIVVFGCGGDRDQLKRPLMGEAVGKIADVALVTSDNPRTEDPRAIIDMIVPGLEKSGMKRRGVSPATETSAGYEVIEDRRAAIERAVGMAEAGDVIVVAGKGHEDYQIVGTERKHFDDREVLEEVLKRGNKE